MKAKTIDINQRIPIDTLEAALVSYLDGNYSNEYVIEQLHLEFSGENRLKKALAIVNKIIPNNPLNGYIIENKKQIITAIKRKDDKNIILIALLNSAYPFSFDVLQTFGKYFSVQKIISINAIKKTISNIYGGNRATENGLYSVIPMFIETSFFTRPKLGIYQWQTPLNISAPITKSIYKASYKAINSISEIQEYQLMDPYFTFIA